MTPSYEAFFDELGKLADAQVATWPKAREALKHALIGGAAAGLGGATGHLLGRAILPRVLPQASQRTLAVLGHVGAGLGVAGGLASAAALARHRRMLEGVQ